MIADLDETIRQLLIADIPVQNGEVEISFFQPKREWSSKLSRPTVNFFLYDLRENATLRQATWDRLPARQNGDGLAYLKRNPYRVDCSYMLTTWATDPDDEHRLLARCLSALFKYPVLPESRLLGELQNQPFEIQARLAAHDHLTNPAEVWSALDNEMRPSISYVITLAVDPWQEIAEPTVRSLVLRSGQAAAAPSQGIDAQAGSGERVWIGGRVYSRSEGKPGMPGVRVTVRGTSLGTETDELGQFRLGSLARGDYTLIGWPTKGKPIEKKVTVPTSQGGYDLEMESK
jgi:hypothetical protein